VALFYARFDVVLAVSRPETAGMALPARTVGIMQCPFAAKADFYLRERNIDIFPTEME